MLATKSSPTAEIVDLVQKLYKIIAANLQDRQPSAENWRWRVQTKIADRNQSPEVVLERAVALLAAGGHLTKLGKWCNQIPVASGLVDHKLDKRAAIDLARILDNRLDLFELKWESDTPIYAAFEILLYGLAYLLCRANQAKLGYEDLDTMRVEALSLNVLAPAAYYESLDLTWLQTGLDAGIRKVAFDLFGADLQASFCFLVLPIGPVRHFASGAEAIAACSGTPLAPSAKTLVEAISNIAPVFQVSEFA